MYSNSEKKVFFSNLLSASKIMWKTWLVIKNITNKSKNKIFHTRFKLNDGNFTMDGTTAVSNKFNEFFINIGPNLAKLIPNQQLSPLWFMRNPIKNFTFYVQWHQQRSVVYYDHWKRVLQVMMKLLQWSISNYTTEPLVDICKEACVFNKYRSVFLLCISSKVLKIMYSRSIYFIYEYKIIV